MASERGTDDLMPGRLVVDHLVDGDVSIVKVTGVLDERFEGLGTFDGNTSLVIDVSGMTRMTSFGVRQWLRAISRLPKCEAYLLGCPTFFVDQLNMVLNFGGATKVLSVVAPYACTVCGAEIGKVVDVFAERSSLAKGIAPKFTCPTCNGALALDENPESYFTFVGSYAPSSINPAVADVLAKRQLYRTADGASETPPRIIKLVHGSVTYFRIRGRIGYMFRARPLLVGAEGEVVVDVADVEHFAVGGQNEWRRLLKGLASHVPAVTLVDVDEALLVATGETLTKTRNIGIASMMVCYECTECGRSSRESVALERTTSKIGFGPRVCATCGGSKSCRLSSETLALFEKVNQEVPPASAKVIAQRDELLSRALTDAKVAEAGDSATPVLATDDIILDKYRIVRPLSSGGMAEVFLAKQVGIEKPIALKRIQRKLLDIRHRAIELFLNEAKIAGRLAHPNIVQVFDVGEVGGALYLAMEYVHGQDLRTIVKKLQHDDRKMPLRDAIHIVAEIAEALDHAYWSRDLDGKQLSVIHRDVSPHNVMLGYDGAVKLLDFGVAASAVTEHEEQVIVGKWLYMAPEVTTMRPIDHRSDLFSLGVILYQLCAGTTPFVGRDSAEIAMMIQSGSYRPLREVVSDIPSSLADLVARMMAPAPEDRLQRGREVAEALAEIARQHHLEGSASSIGRLVAGVLPRQPIFDSSGLTEIMDFAPQTARDRSPLSITPTKQVDVSETLRRPGIFALPPKPASAPASAPASGPVPAPASGPVSRSPQRASNLRFAVILISSAILILLGLAVYGLFNE